MEMFHIDGSWLCTVCHEIEKAWANEDFEFEEEDANDLQERAFWTGEKKAAASRRCRDKKQGKTTKKYSQFALGQASGGVYSIANCYDGNPKIPNYLKPIIRIRKLTKEEIDKHTSGRKQLKPLISLTNLKEREIETCQTDQRFKLLSSACVLIDLLFCQFSNSNYWFEVVGDFGISIITIGN
jgi:hypothetical protein